MARAPASIQLADPFCATQIPAAAGQTSGNVLIADSNDNHRVVEIRSDDYVRDGARPRATPPPASSGSTASRDRPARLRATSTRRARPSVSPTATPSSRTPPARGSSRCVTATTTRRSRQRLHGREHRLVLRERGRRRPAGPEHRPRTSRAGRWPGPSSSPTVTGRRSAVRIIDQRRPRTIDDDLDLSTYDRPANVGPTDAASPRDARVAADGSLWIADAGFGQILRIGNEGSGTVASVPLDCGKPGMLKAFVRLKIEAPAQSVRDELRDLVQRRRQGLQEGAHLARRAQRQLPRPGRRASASPIASCSRRPTAGRRRCSRG